MPFIFPLLGIKQILMRLSNSTVGQSLFRRYPNESVLWLSLLLLSTTSLSLVLLRWYLSVVPLFIFTWTELCWWFIYFSVFFSVSLWRRKKEKLIARDWPFCAIDSVIFERRMFCIYHPTIVACSDLVHDSLYTEFSRSHRKSQVSEMDSWATPAVVAKRPVSNELI